MKRYESTFDSSYGMIIHEERKDGKWISTKDCIIAEQDNMMMGDPVDNLWRQIQEQAMNKGPFDVMIILKGKE